MKLRPLHPDPGRPAFLSGGVARSHGELLGSARAIVGRFTRKPGHVINLCQDRFHFSAAFVAALLSQAPNLLPPNQQLRTLQDLARRYSDCVIAIDTDEHELRDVLERIDVPVIDVTGAPAADVDAPQAVSPQHIAAIAFTSGSTGEPTAIPKPWCTLYGTTTMLCERFIAPHDGMGIVATVPPQHMYGLETSVLTALVGGCLVHAARPFFPADIALALAEIPAPRLLVTTPIHLRALLASHLALPELAGVISATAPLARELAAAAATAWACPVREIYGCSEGGSLASRDAVHDDYWTTLAGIHFAAGPAGVTVTAPHLDAQVTLQDELALLSPTQFRFLGRGSDMLNIGGKRASLADVNRQLQDIEGVEDAVVFLPEEDSDRGRLAALVVSKLDKRDILRRLAERLDPVFLPRPLRRVAAIPRNPVGKITRAALLAALAQAERDGD